MRERVDVRDNVLPWSFMASSINRSDPRSRTRERVESERPRAWNEEGLFNAEAVNEMDSERLRATLARVHTRVPMGSF